MAAFLPSSVVRSKLSDWSITKTQVFWPEISDPTSASVRSASDHRLVALHLSVSEIATPAPIQELTLKRTKNQVELQWQALAGHDYQELNHPSRSSLT